MSIYLQLSFAIPLSVSLSISLSIWFRAEGLDEVCIKLYLEQERIHEFRTLVLLRNGSCVALGLGQRPGHHQSMGVW